jgi:folate-dependent phosphoribosylglycinamide formyltransferase PurN
MSRSFRESVAAPGGGARPIVLMTAGGELGNIVVNGIAALLGPVVVIEERPEAKLDIIRRRLRLCGPVMTLGQIAFGLHQKLTSGRRKARLEAIWRQYGLEPRSRSGMVVHRVPSVNSEECRDLLRRLDPAVVAVYGTRIIGAATLGAVSCPFINYHAGINPKYRGQHPGYWARACGDEANCGVTIHVVDRGVDTGQVLYQARVALGAEDTIATYQHVQAAHALPLFARAIVDGEVGRLRPRTVELPSNLWFPPTLWRYLATGLSRGVW